MVVCLLKGPEKSSALPRQGEVYFRLWKHLLYCEHARVIDDRLDVLHHLTIGGGANHVLVFLGPLEEHESSFEVAFPDLAGGEESLQSRDLALYRNALAHMIPRLANRSKTR
jgi:hypothetical protein